jgi:hypothetical protein
MTDRRQFTWHEIDIRKSLPNSWKRDIIRLADNFAVARTIIPTSVTSRESSKKIKIPVMTVGGGRIRSILPWLYDLYRGLFRDLGQTFLDEPVTVATNDRYAINLNIQKGTRMRYECHVDSNPLEGLLYVTDQPKGRGGELVVANRPDAEGVRAIKADCECIYPKAGRLVFFDARHHPHYVAPLRDENDIRIAVTMNFYTPACPESARPRDLNKHLFGEDF